MPYSIYTLLTRNLQDVFGENDPARRRAATDEIYTEDVVFYEQPSKKIYRGRDEIDRRAGALRAQHPDFRYEPIGEPEEVGDGGESSGSRAALARPLRLPARISSSSGAAGLLPSISSSTRRHEPKPGPRQSRHPNLSNCSA